MKKFYIENMKYIITGAVLITLLIMFFICNLLLSLSKDVFLQRVNDNNTNKISVRSIIYIFPDKLTLKNVTVKNKNSDESIMIPSAAVKFSIPAFLREKELFLRTVILNNPKIDINKIYPFFEELVFKKNDMDNFEQIRKIKINNAVINSNEQSSDKFKTFNLTLNKKGKFIDIKGSIVDNEYVNSGNGKSQKVKKKAIPLKYSFKTILKKNGFFLQEIVFNKGLFHLKLWGDYDQNDLKLRGYSFMNNVYLEKKMEDIWKSNKNKNKDVLLSNEAGMNNFFLLDIDTDLKITADSLKINHLYMIANNKPVNFKGEINFKNGINYNLSANLFFDINQSNLKSVELKMKGDIKDSKAVSNGYVNFYLDRNKKTSLQLRKFGFKFEEFVLDLDDNKSIRAHIVKGDMLCHTNSERYGIKVDNLLADFNLENENYKLIEFESSFYGGNIKGNLGINSEKSPYKINLSAEFNDVDVGSMPDFILPFSNLKGRMNYKMNFNNYPYSICSGDIDISQGKIQNFAVLNWVSEYFNLLSFKEIDFNNTSLNFIANKNGLDLYDIFLKSEDINLNGRFHLNSENMVNSKLSISFSKKIMSQSTYFKPLLNRLKKDIDFLDFDFRLSGSLNSINFQWLQSDLKSEIQDKIPNFIQQRIENSLEMPSIDQTISKN